MAPLSKGQEADALRLCGFSALEVRRRSYSCEELLAGGFTPAQLKEAGFLPADMRKCGLPNLIVFPLHDILAGGFTISELMAVYKYEADSLEQARRSNRMTWHQPFTAWFKSLKLHPRHFRGMGLSMANILEACELSQVANEFTLDELGLKAEACYRNQWLQNLQNTQWKSLGFTAGDFRSFMISPKIAYTSISFAMQVVGLGPFSWKELRDGGWTIHEFKQYFDNARKQQRGEENLSSEWQLYISDSNKRSEILQAAFIKRLYTAGFSAKDMALAGYSVLVQGQESTQTLRQLRDSGADTKLLLQQLSLSGFAASTWRTMLSAVGVTARDMVALMDHTNSLEHVRQAGFTPVELKEAGATCDKLVACFQAHPEHSLKECGFSVPELQRAGASVHSLLRMGYTLAEIIAGGVPVADVLKAGYEPVHLRQADVPCSTLKPACSAEALKSAGYTAEAMFEAGFTIQELRAVSFSPEQLVRIPGLPAAEYRALGISLDQLRGTGVGARDLKVAGYTAVELKSAGYSMGEVEELYTLAELRAAGFIQEGAGAGAAPSASGGNADCPVCWSRPKDTAFQCGHTHCATCAAALSKCPMCNAPVTSRLKLYV